MVIVGYIVLFLGKTELMVVNGSVTQYWSSYKGKSFAT